MTDLKRPIRDVADFPRPGILFRDIARLLRNHFAEAIEAMGGLLTAEQWRRVDAVAGIESRGFMLGAVLAQAQAKGFVPIRKQGKLPPAGGLVTRDWPERLRFQFFAPGHGSGPSPLR